MTKHNPFQDWNWDKEMQVQILHSIDLMVTYYANANRKKGSKKAEVPEFNRPDYVQEAFEQAKEKQREENREQQKELAEFFEKRNAQMKELKEQIKKGEEDA